MHSLAENPFAELELAAARQAATELACKAVLSSRSRLVLGKDARSVFFSTLALRLKPEVAWDRDTMSTDGKALRYNPEFVNGLTQDELVGVVVHETLHCALGHHARMGNRDVEKWN